jgi:hypothetical protein
MKNKIAKMDIPTLIMKYLLNRDLEGATDFTSESWTDSNSCATYETEPTDFTSESSTPSNSCTTCETEPTAFTSESSTPSNSCTTCETEPNQSSDTGLLIAVIVLAVIILLLVGGAGVAYLRYVRSVF